MAERIRLKPYIVVTFFMTIVHSVPAHWVWSTSGFLYQMGCLDAAGCSAVHLVGGIAGLTATMYLKPRQGRFGGRSGNQMSNPTNALLGTFMLITGWLSFNAGKFLPKHGFPKIMQIFVKTLFERLINPMDLRFNIWNSSRPMADCSSSCDEYDSSGSGWRFRRNYIFHDTTSNVSS